MAKRRSEVAREWGAGFRKEKGTAKGTRNRESIRGDEYIHDLDHGGGFTATRVYV